MRTILLLFLLVCVGAVIGKPQDYSYDDEADCDYDDIFGSNDCDNESEQLKLEEPDEDPLDDIFGGDDEDSVSKDVFGDDDPVNKNEKKECVDAVANEDLIFDIREDRVIQDCNKNVTCSHWADKGFKCAPYHQCQNKDRSPVITDGEGKTAVHLIDLRSNLCVKLEGTLDASDSKCETEGHVCCENPDVKAKVCKAENGNDFNQCGRTSQKTKITQLDKKAKGSAQPGEFSHMCIIYKKTSGGVPLYHGGASLIAKNKVISVAHKFWVTRKKTGSVDHRQNANDFVVRCGEYNVRKEKELIRHQETEAAAMYFHPLYDPKDKYLANNLVILRTKENFIYQDHIGPVCLPRPTDTFETDNECSSSGWGKTQFEASGSYSDILKKIDMGIIPHKECNQRMKTKLRRFKAHKSMVCVGGEKGSDTCTGDGGSPHVCKRDGKWYQVGAVAWGIGCGDGIPAIYASIPDAMCWIDQIMTCVPLAARDINNDDEIIDIRGTGDDEKQSVNELTTEECKAWNQSGADFGECQVIYSDDEYGSDYDIRSGEYDYDTRVEGNGK